LIVAINTGVAAILSLDDARPFWHPFISAQSFGLSIAYAVNAASPWDKPRPVWRLIVAVAIGTAIGVALLIAIKGYVIAEESYRLESVRLRVGQFAWVATHTRPARAFHDSGDLLGGDSDLGKSSG
jgi:hypothetical protein